MFMSGEFSIFDLNNQLIGWYVLHSQRSY
jgi:hypothetical protein